MHNNDNDKSPTVSYMSELLLYFIHHIGCAHNKV